MKQVEHHVIRDVYAGVVVDDLPAARTWYERVLGRPPDAAPMDGLYEWRVPQGGRFQLVDVHTIREIQRRSTWGTAGSSSISFVIDDAEHQSAVLAAAGIPIVSTFDTGSVKTVTVADPAGNFVTFVEQLPGGA